MRVRGGVYLIAGALGALTLVAGCGDSNTTIDITDQETPTPGARTATPARTPTAGGATSTAAKTATPAGATSTAGGATPTAAGATATTGGATPTSGGSATPGATATGPTSTNPSPTPSPGAINAQVQTIVKGDLLPFLTGTSLLTGGSVSGALVANATVFEDGDGGTPRAIGDAVKNDPCPDGGTRVDDEGVPTRTITLTNCDVSPGQLGQFRFNGTVVINLTSLSGGTIQFTVDVTDKVANHTVHFAGTLNAAVQGGGFVLNGDLVLTTPEGNFTLHLVNITIDSNRKLVSGSGSITDDADNFDIQMIQMVVNQGGATATFTVTFDDTSVQTYDLDLQTGELTQTG